MNIKPFGKRVLIRKLQVEKKGVLILNESKNVPFKAEVLEVSDQSEYVLKKGDILLIPHWASVFINDDENLMLIDEANIMGRILL